MLKIRLPKILLISSLWLGLLPLSAWAAGILPAETGQKTGACASPNGCGNYSLMDFLQLAVKVSDWILGSVGAIALLFFVYGGFVFILSGGNEEKVKEGKQILINSIIGLAIVFTSYIIIKFAAGLLGAGVTPGLQINIPAR